MAAIALGGLAALMPAAASARPIDRPPAAHASRLLACTIVGTQRDDVLTGTPGRDVICARGGDDVVRGEGGDDVIYGGPGNDRVDGGAGNDRLYGWRGADRLSGGSGDDFLQGGPDADVLAGGPGTDTVDYSTRRDSLHVTIGRGANDGLRGEGDDVRGDVEIVRAGSGNDVLVGNGRANGLYGGAGRDLLRGRGGRDTLAGGRGVDTIDCGRGGSARVLAGAKDHLHGNCGRPRPQPSHPRAAIRLSNASVAENQPAGTLVGTLSARGFHRAHFALAGGPDDASFAISGNRLVTGAMFDFETKSAYTVGIRVTARHRRAYAQAFTITVTDVNEPPAVNRAPVATDGSETVDEDQPKAIDLGALASDAETSDANLTYTIVAQPAHGTLTGTGPAPSYTPAANYHGPDSFTYKVTDRGSPDGCTGAPPVCAAPLSSATQTVSLTVDPVNDAPVAPAANLSVDEDHALAIDLTTLASDLETSSANLTFAIVGAPAHGTLAGNGAAWTYTPAADYNGPDAVVYTVMDRGDPDNCAAGPGCSAPVTTTGTIAIGVNPVNDAPVAHDGSATTDEDQPATVDLGALASDLETSDANLTYTIVAAPAHGTLTGTGPAPSYTPAANYHGPDSFTYKVTDRGDPDGCSGGAPACDAPQSSATKTISLTVAPVNDRPVASDGHVNATEDTPSAVDLSALASDDETSDANLAYTVTGGPAHGTLTGAGASRTYTPNPDYNGADSFTYTVTDRGDPDNCGAVGPGCTAPLTSIAGTVNLAVAAVNDAPVTTVPAGPVTAVEETDTPLAGLSVADVDAGGDAVQLTLSALHGTLKVSTSVFGGVSLAVGNNSKTVTVTASLAQIDATLADANGLVYHGDAGYTGPDTLTVHSDDLGHNGSGGPLTDTDTLALSVVPPNQPPVATDQSVSTNEDTATAITLAATDADGDPLTFAIVSGPAHGSLTGAGAARTYTPDPDFNGSDSFTFKANDGRADSAPATVSITVNAVNDAPQFAGIEAGALAYTENDPATQVTATTTVSDVDSANFDTGTLTVDYSAGGTVDDRLEVGNIGQIATSAADVTYNGTTIGSFAGGSGTTALVVTLNANADAAATQALVRAITYRNVSDNPATAARTVRFVLSDGDGGTSAPATRSIGLTAVNDAPALAGIEAGALGYVESVDSAPAQSQITNNLTVSDPDNANLAGATVQITGACRSGEDVLVFSTQNGITGTYTAATCRLVLTGSASLASYQTALRSVKYEDSSDTPDTSTRTVAFTVNDGALDSNTQSRDVTVTAANDSPTGVADTFNGTNSALAGVTLAVGTTPSTPNVAVAGSVLTNDTDPDTAQANLTAAAGTSSANGGVVALNADGSFTYTPAPGFTGSDSFTYTVHDHGTPDRTGTGTVTINVAGPRVWFVDPSAGAGGDGTSRAPLNSLAPLSNGGASDGLDGTGDAIFVYQGAAAAGGFVLEANQRLVGQPQGLSVTNGNGTYDLVTAGGANPTITNSAGAGLTLADGDTVQRIDVKNASGAGVTGSGVNTLAYGANTTISGNGGGGLALSGAAGGAVSVGAAITTTAGHSVSIANRTSGTTTLSGAINDTGTGISLAGNTGATINLTGGVTASTGANGAFTATGGGTVGVTGSANTLTTTTATALNVTGTTIGAGGLNFQKISSNGGASTGIILDGTGSSGGLTVSGTGTAASGGTIANKTGADGSTSTGIGIYLNNTQSPSFARMQLNDFQNFAIRGTGVNGFTLSDSTINGSNGTSTAADEASAAFDNLTGTAAITNDNISGGVEDDVRIQNTTGSLNSLSITGSTFATTGAATANDALALLGKSGAAVFNATVQGNTFARAQGDLYQYTLETGTGTMHFDSNTVTNSFPTTLPAGGGDINISAGSLGSSPSLTYSINNNSIFTSGTGLQPPNGSVIVAAATPQGSATGTIQNNTIGATGVTQSGGFDSILADAVKAGFHKVTITGNTIRRYKEAGIRLLGVSPAAAPGFNLRATVKGNTITEPDSVAFAGIDAEVGADPADVGTMCLDLGGTTAVDKNSVAAGDPNNFNDINILQQFATGINLPGYSGGATDDAAVEAFVAARNDGNGTPTVFAGHDAAGSGFTGSGTNCS